MPRLTPVDHDPFAAGPEKWQPPQPDPVSGAVPADPVGKVLLGAPGVLARDAQNLWSTAVSTPLDLIQHGGTEEQLADAGTAVGGLMSTGGLAGAGDEAALGMGFRAYHGSPHAGVTAFDRAKLGTGEGNLWQGHGFYLTSSPDVADLYRETPALPGVGSRYTVDVGPEHHDFVDYNLPLNQQPRHVQEAINGFLDKIDPTKSKFFRTGDGEGTLESLNEAMMHFHHDAGLSRALRDAGLPGIRYKNTGSVAPDATNYVVFDPAHAAVTHENDVPVAGGAPAALAPRPASALGGERQPDLAPRPAAPPTSATATTYDAKGVADHVTGAIGAAVPSYAKPASALEARQIAGLVADLVMEGDVTALDSLARSYHGQTDPESQAWLAAINAARKLQVKSVPPGVPQT